jgi:hypothetical protein
MRPRSFLSAVVIYGTGFGIGVPFLLWFLGAVTRTPWPFTAIEVLLIGVMFGLPFGLVLGYLQGPTERTFNYEFSQDFRDRLEASLRSLHYQPHNESPSHLTYRIAPFPHGSLLPVIPDIMVDKDTSPVRVSGPRNKLGQLEKKLRVG